MIDLYVEGLSIDIGRQGENIARNIYFDLSDLIDNYGEGTATLVHMRPSDNAPYICEAERVGNFLIWAPTSTDMAYAGSGKCELRWVVGETLAKSIIYTTTIAPSITGAGEVPDPYESWYEALLEHISEYDIASDQIAANTSQIAANTSDIAVLDGRVDELTTLPEGSTTGDAELADIRVGADGTVYNNAGDAVRGQVGDLKSALGNIDLTELFELGGVYTDNGFVYTNTNARVRIKKGTTLPFSQGEKIGLTDYSNARFYACWCNKSGEYKYSGWKTADYTVTEDGDYVIMIANTQDTAQTDEKALASLFFGYQAVAFDYIIDNQNRIENLKTVGYVTNPGFITGNGSINAQTENKEVYTDKIPVTNGMIIDLSLSFSTIRSGWVAYATYTSSGAFISRTVLLNSVNVNKYSGEIVITDTNVSYIAFTYRTYDDCTMSITSPKNAAILYKAIQNTNDDVSVLRNELNIRESLCPIILSGSATNYYVDVIIDSTESSITFPTDTLLLFRDGSYKSLSATTFNFDSSVISTTAIKIVYSRSTQTLKAIRFDHNVADNEVLVATIRRNANRPSVFINCAYRLNGYLYGVNVFDQLGDTNPIIKSVNHRGYYTAPENTLPAYKLSKKNGFKYVECDVSFTSDGIPVLLHDNTINRTARNADGTSLSGDININDITYAQALTYDFGIYKSSEYAGTKIPKLEDFLVLCRNLGLHPYVELKSSATYSESQIRSLVDMAEKCGMKNNLTWISFKSAFLTYVKDYDAEARIGYVIDSITEANITRANNLMTEGNEVFLDCDYTQLTNETIALCINANIPLEVWTVDTANEITALNPYITGVTSDNLVAGNVLYNANI